uniref:Uncharacterized protein n=1 Tax=Arundo donax TaxID=35708 RepID=A0A0A9US86_ARUDO
MPRQCDKSSRPITSPKYAGAFGRSIASSSRRDPYSKKPVSKSDALKIFLL